MVFIGFNDNLDLGCCVLREITVIFMSFVVAFVFILECDFGLGKYKCLVKYDVTGSRCKYFWFILWIITHKGLQGSQAS